MTEIAITGIGLLTPLGVTAADNLAAWRAGTVAPRAPLPELAETPLAAAPVAQPPAFDAGTMTGNRRMLKYMSPAAVLGCAAAHAAIADAGIIGRYAAERIGLYAGSGLAAANLSEVATTVEHSVDEHGIFSTVCLGRDGLAATNPLLSFRILPNMPPCLISIIEGIKGPNLILTPWAAQTAAALYEAWRAVTDGEVDCAVAGAADTPAQPATFVYLRQAGLLHDGEVPASAAAYLIIERAAAAQAAGRQPYALVRNLKLAQSSEPAADPLAMRCGQSFAAAPAVMLALTALAGEPGMTMACGDGQTFSAKLGRP